MPKLRHKLGVLQPVLSDGRGCGRGEYGVCSLHFSPRASASAGTFGCVGEGEYPWPRGVFVAFSTTGERVSELNWSELGGKYLRRETKGGEGGVCLCRERQNAAFLPRASL